MDFDKTIKERHSVRNFKQGKKPDYRKIMEIVGAGIMCPLAGSIASMKYIIVSDTAKIIELAEASQQDFIAKVGFVIVLCSDDKNLEKHYYERGKVYARQQAGASIENMLLKITELGFASCWIGAFSDETVRRILKIPDNIHIEALLPVGYELGRGKQARKPDLDRVIYFDEWDNKYMADRRMTAGNRT